MTKALGVFKKKKIINCREMSFAHLNYSKVLPIFPRKQKLLIFTYISERNVEFL